MFYYMRYEKKKGISKKVSAKCAETAKNYFTDVCSKRKSASTTQNSSSSRSHMIMKMTSITTTTTNEIIFVDLAGKVLVIELIQVRMA